MKKIEKNNGVTLIALVVTIIVLVILAGVSITALTGEKGLIGQAKEAKKDTRAATVEEARDLWEIDNEGSDVPMSLEEFLADLKIKKLITEEEEQTILNSYPHTVRIGKKEIEFHEKEMPKIPIGNETYVGQYADFENDSGERIPDGKPDGIIFADLAAEGNDVEKQWGNSWELYTIPKVDSGLKQYYIKREEVIDKRWSETESKKLISPINSSGQERFYVMALEDVDSNEHNWYINAYNKMTDYSTYTSEDFGTGRENTKRMIVRSQVADGSIPEGYPNAGTIPYGAIAINDIWALDMVRNKFDKGWFVPSIVEWAAFANQLKIVNFYNGQFYGNYKLKYCYWSSSQFGAFAVSCAHFNNGSSIYFDVNNQFYVRLASTF